MGISEVREYDCWLQGRGQNQFSDALKNCLSRIVVKEDCLVVKQAALELQRGLKRMFGVDAAITDTIQKPCTVVGTAKAVSELTGKTVSCDRAEGFCIEIGDELSVVAGADCSGTLYGAFRLLMELAKGAGTGFSLEDAPRSGIRMINHWDNLDGTIERGYAGPSLFYKDDKIDYDPQRIEDYARLLASIGINCLSINNVNVRKTAKLLITEQFLPDVAKLADIFRPFGIRLMLSINFGAPYSFGDLNTADPLDPRVGEWWAKRADLVYKYIPDLAGFLVKADSEGEAGPFQYGRDHADGANMLAKALKPHNGTVIWRCFVYNCTQDWRDQTQDRACAAYDHFMPLDGRFDDNVILQIKHGPYDFQVREPVTPLFGALKKTRHLIEFQITQEYTGHQIDVCFLPYMWQDVYHFDTKHGENSTIGGMMGNRISGAVAVGSVGRDENWTGNTLSQANWFGFGRLAWNPDLTAEEIADEWVKLTFGLDPEVDAAVNKILMMSYPTYENYNAPFGVCFMVTRSLHYGPDIEGYEYSRWGTYHRANWEAVGVDRTPSGTNYTGQYAPENAAMFADLSTCPENLMLFFHRVPYSYVMKNGKNLLQNIYDTHFKGVEQVEEIIRTWEGIQDKIGSAVYASVRERMGRQLTNAIEWRDVVNTYFHRHTGIPDEQGRKIYD